MSNYKRIHPIEKNPLRRSHRTPSSQFSDATLHEDGLETKEVLERQANYGPNEIKEREKNPYINFLKYFWGPMPFLIWTATLIELIRLVPLNFVFLLFLQFVNGLVWYYEDRSSTEAIKTLKINLAPKAKVKRDRIWKIVPARDLVVGDKIFISPGDLFPADCILGPGELRINQSMLTGETIPVTKTEGARVYMGSICKKGEIEAYVCSTGKNTFFQRNTTLITEVQRKGNVQKVLTQIAFLLMSIAGILVMVIFVILLVKGNEFLECIAICAVLMVISLPIAMQVVCATTLAVGAKSLNKQKAVVSCLSSIEELAGMDALCISKSGFLTKDELIIKSPILFNSSNDHDVFLLALLASKKEKDSQNTIDKYIYEYAIEQYNLNLSSYEEEDFINYDAKNKMTMANIRNTVTGECFSCCKGSPQVIMSLTENIQLNIEITKNVYELANQGFSSIAIGKTNTHGKWDIYGLIPIYYIFSEDIEKKIQSLKNLNIKITILTGDNLQFCKEVCRKVSFGDVIFNAEVFNSDDNIVQKELVEATVLNADGYAEVYPEHKFTLVKMLQRQGKKVGITGVSISDAPAMKCADVGLAAYGATDAAKTAADIIYHEQGLEPIIKSIEKAREIFQRAETYCVYRIYCSFQLLLFFFVGAVFVKPDLYSCSGVSGCKNLPNVTILPVLTFVIIALLNNGIIIAIAYDSQKPSAEPKKWNLPLIFILSCILGSVSFFSSTAFLYFTLSHMDCNEPNMILDYLSLPCMSYGEVLTGVFLKISISNYLAIFSVRSKNMFFMSFPGIAVTCASILALISTTLISKYWYLNLQPINGVIAASLSPISWKMVFTIWVFDFTIFILQDFVKVSIFKGFEKFGNKSQNYDLTKLLLAETFLNCKHKSRYISTQKEIYQSY
ncbi:hypothetical protein SteCoe_11957 [Stentor coeruleus]|uniref:Plasma membrane ATPase n=1 Tax=Stentor coeruleus TaxID=5963 RepID=A0A1R2CBZ5_9CILI|nr:hypothetical protein SteCoe_11957 [Stentor coeruleus]